MSKSSKVKSEEAARLTYHEMITTLFVEEFNKAKKTKVEGVTY